MSSALTVQEYGLQNIQALLSGDAMQRQLAMACGRALDPVKLARIAFTELRRTPRLAECSRESFLGSLMTCAQLGLEPGPHPGNAYLIPYGKECQFQMGYKGMIELMWRSDKIASIASEVVYANDAFAYQLGTNAYLNHTPAEGDRGDRTHVYAQVRPKGGDWMFKVRTFDWIEEHRKQYVKGKGGPWLTAWDEMACKTVIKQLAKLAPVSTEMSTAIALDDKVERGISQGLGAMAPTIDIEPEAPSSGDPAADEAEG